MFVQSLMVAKAKEELEQEILDKDEEKHNYLAERAPPLSTSGLSLAQLQVTYILKFPESSHYSLQSLTQSPVIRKLVQVAKDAESPIQLQTIVAENQ